jgi:hypothetical protein
MLNIKNDITFLLSLCFLLISLQHLVPMYVFRFNQLTSDLSIGLLTTLGNATDFHVRSVIARECSRGDCFSYVILLAPQVF